mgnify:CR=1 FL=1
MMDKIDELIISTLSQDSKQSTFEIWDFLKKFEIHLSEKEIESRISRLESEQVIKGYTIKVDTKKIPHKVIRVDLVTFRTSQSLPKRMEDLKKYLNNAPFVLYFCQMIWQIKKMISTEICLGILFKYMKCMTLYHKQMHHYTH